MQPSRDRPGNQISCCLLSLHFLCAILTTHPVAATDRGRDITQPSRRLSWHDCVRVLCQPKMFCQYLVVHLTRPRRNLKQTFILDTRVICNAEIANILRAHVLYALMRLSYPQVLKNGVVLCQLMNKISPGSVKKFKTSGPAFLLMENISAFQVS